MSDDQRADQPAGMTAGAALRLEFGIIGLGILALVMIFQPLSLTLFSIGCGLVVIAALANNLLPLAQPGTPARTIVLASIIVATILCTAVLVAIGAAHTYGLLFLNPPPAAANRAPPAPFWEHSFVWGVAALDAVLWLSIYLMRRGR